jgi:HSP20 family protein
MIMTTLIPWSRSSSSPLNRFRNELEEMFDRFTDVSLFGNGDAAKVWQPRVDVEETDKEITVKVDLPGVDPKDIEIQVLNGVLTLKGEKKEEKEEKKKNYHRVERFYGAFYREIPLTAAADSDKVVATSAKGVITISVPKKAELQPKKITVKSQD